MAGMPVVAIGGILTVERLGDAARCGVDGVCVVRMPGDDPQATVVRERLQTHRPR